MTGNTPAASNRPRVPPAERLVFFTDAVVAIAMTLLILPLMESIGDAPDEGDTLHWLGAHRSQLVSFVLSFVIISVFWRAHHRLFEHVATVTQRLFVLDFCWMFTVVWLPIATALTGAMRTFDPESRAYDRTLVLLYIGTLAVNSLLLYLMSVVVRRTPATWRPDDPPTRRMGEAVNLSMTILFSLAAVLALLFPAINMATMLLLFFTGPLANLLLRRSTPPSAP